MAYISSQALNEQMELQSDLRPSQTNGNREDWKKKKKNDCVNMVADQQTNFL